MITFEEFIKSLGRAAGRYSDAELERLYVDVHQFADFLLSLHRAKKKPPRPATLSTVSTVDGTVTDRTVET